MLRGFLLMCAALLARGAHDYGIPYVWLQEGASQCFYTELSPDSHVLINYAFPTLDPQVRLEEFKKSQGSDAVAHSHPLSLLLTITAPDGSALHPAGVSDGVIKDVSGHVGFTATHWWGQYSICFKTSTSHWTVAEKFKLYVSIDTGNNLKVPPTEDGHENVRTAIEVLDNNISELKNDIHQIRDEAAYFSARELRFRWTTGSTYERVFWFSLIHVIILIVSSIFQVLYLKSFLRRKKIV